MCIRDRDAYTLSVTTVCCVLWTVNVILKLCTVDYSYLINRMDFCTSTLISVTLVYYQIKLYICQSQTCNYITKIVHVDQSLESVQVKVPHTRNKVECVLLIVLSIIFFAFYNYEKLYYATFSCLVLDLSKMYKFTCVITNHVCFTVFFQYCYYLMYIIRCV